MLFVKHLHLFEVELVVCPGLLVLLLDHSVHFLEDSIHRCSLQFALFLLVQLSVVLDLLIGLRDILNHLQIVHDQSQLVHWVGLDAIGTVLENGRNEELQENRAFEGRNVEV